MFEGECWDMAYYRVWINTDPRMRHRMLDGIKSVIEMWKYILQQDDFGTGNEEAIFRQMVDPSSANPFDLSHVLPAGAGTQYLTRIVNNVKPRPYHRPQDTPCTDDIPLDWQIQSLTVLSCNRRWYIENKGGQKHTNKQKIEGIGAGSKSTSYYAGGLSFFLLPNISTWGP